ncbi:lipid II flippase MurJ [Loigolactobacillus zhaoyuanensis]|uniref:lipid II flippase MurJ n=1 Tax=Loigolactobacillus zhaoyuanensis TaxID=2486017 RepID=UPI000F73E8F3|nr:lipid II flippase MurJ [Loigolactobacillus zhaoyuanensis]
MKRITYSFPFVITISLVIQGLGLIRSLVLAKDFGTSSMLDAFYLANVFTVSIFTIIGSAITTIVIPELNAKISFQQRKIYIEKYLTFIRILALILSSILFIIIIFGSNFIVPNFSTQNKILFIILTGILLISQQFKIQASFSVSLLQNEGHYITPRVLDIIPVGIPALYLLLVNSVNIVTLTILTAIAYILETMFFNYLQYRLNPEFVFRIRFGLDSDVKKMLTNTVPILLSSTVFQIQIMLSNYVAGFFGHGYITLLSNTNQIMGIFQSLFIMNLINMIYPKLVKDIKKNLQDGISHVSRYVSLTNLIVILLIWGYAAVGFDLIKLLFVRGAFTATDARTVYQYGLILGLAMPFDVIRDYSYRIYYANGNTKKPMSNSLTTVVINIVLIVIFAKLIGPASIIVAPALGTFFSTTLIVSRSYREGIKINIKSILLNYLLANILGFVMYLVINTSHYTSGNLVQELAINIIIGVVFVVLVILLIVYILRLMGNDIIKKIFK